MTGHAQRKHAKLSASGRSRWSTCARSIFESSGLSEVPSTSAALEGTRAHEWAEWMLRQGVTDATEYIGAKRGDNCDGPEHELTEPMADAINIYLDAVWAALVPHEQTELYIEQRLDELQQIDPDLGGTFDSAVLNVVKEEADLFDFKNGWYSVGAQNNKQALVYAQGLVLKFPQHKFRKIRIHIVQPRDFPAVKTWAVSGLELFDDRQLLKREVAATRDPNAKHVPGQHCTFCPAAFHMTCRPRAEYVQREAAAGFEAVNGARPQDVPGEKLLQLLETLPTIKKYAEQLDDFLKQACRARRLPGKKPVAFQMRRVWNKPQEEIVGAVTSTFKVSPWDQALRKVADIEREVGKKAFATFAKLHVKHVQFGTQIADVSDERPAIDHNASEGFEVVS